MHYPLLGQATMLAVALAARTSALSGQTSTAAVLRADSAFRTITPGALVRVIQPEVPCVGHLLAWDAERVNVHCIGSFGRGSTDQAFPRPIVTRIDVLRGRHARTVRGAFLGVVLGSVVGGVAGYRSAGPDLPPSPGGCSGGFFSICSGPTAAVGNDAAGRAVKGAFGGALGGALVGAAIGSFFHGPGWETVYDASSNPTGLPR